MNALVSFDHERRGEVTFAVLTLDRAERANSLVPELVDALNQALSGLDVDGIGGLVLRSAGRFFSSGGDVAGFACLEGKARRDYAEALVGGLQKAVLTLYGLPVPVLARLQGGVTGGAAGLIFVADLVAMDERAFIQPYYSEVGFAPDGGWTGLLSERLPAHKALSIQALNRRVLAEEALALGLVDGVAPASGLDAVVEDWLQALSKNSRATMTATKRLLRTAADMERMRLRLEAERHEFLRLIEAADTTRRMQAFLNKA